MSQRIRTEPPPEEADIYATSKLFCDEQIDGLALLFDWSNLIREALRTRRFSKPAGRCTRMQRPFPVIYEGAARVKDEILNRRVP